MFSLESYIGLIVPDTGENSVKITPDQLSDRVSIVEHKLSHFFGGCTSLIGVGSYIGENTFIREGVVICLSWATREAYDDHYDRVLTWASYLARWWCQETIGIIDTHFHLHLISESDYIDRCTKVTIPPPDYLELLPDIPNEQALSFWNCGYSIAAAKYEFANQVIK